MATATGASRRARRADPTLRAGGSRHTEGLRSHAPLGPRRAAPRSLRRRSISPLGVRARGRVLSLPPSVRLFMATQAVDGRKGADSLMVLVRDVLKHDPMSGHLFIFFSRRADRVRIVYWDRNGFAMWT